MKTVVVEPIKVKRLPEIIETHIKNLIINGKIKADEQLPTEKEISRQFGVSIVTVREALKGLEVSGLIEKKKGRGGGVFAIQPKSEMVKNSLYSFLSSKSFSSQHLTQLRLIIEPAAVKIAASKIKPSEINMLERNILNAESNIYNMSHDERKQMNIEFHRLIAETTKNPVLSLTIDYVLDFLFHYKLKTLATNINFIRAVISEHRLILDGLKTRNIVETEKAMVSHLKNVEKYFAKNEGKL